MRRRRGGLEREVVAVLVAEGGALTPARVRAALGAELAYTTVMTVLARLCTKGVVTRERAGRAFAYRVVADDAAVAAHRIRRLLDADGDRAAVLTRLVGTLSPDDERILGDLLHRADEPAGGAADEPAGGPDAGEGGR